MVFDAAEAQPARVVGHAAGGGQEADAHVQVVADVSWPRWKARMPPRTSRAMGSSWRGRRSGRASARPRERGSSTGVRRPLMTTSQARRRALSGAPALPRAGGPVRLCRSARRGSSAPWGAGPPPTILTDSSVPPIVVPFVTGVTHARMRRSPGSESCCASAVRRRSSGWAWCCSRPSRLGALALAVPVVDGRSFGGFLSHRIVCAVRGRPVRTATRWRARTGAEDAELVRRLAPGRGLRAGRAPDARSTSAAAARSRCAAAPDDRDLDAHRTDAGGRPPCSRASSAAAGAPTSSTGSTTPTRTRRVAGLGRDWARGPRAVRGGWRSAAGYPGFHRDDWEGYQVRIDRDGTHRRARDLPRPPPVVQAGRVPRTAGGRGRAGRACRAAATPATSRSSARSPARAAARRRARAARGGCARATARLPGVDLRERTTHRRGHRLVPLERLEKRGYRRLGEGVSSRRGRRRCYDRPGRSGFVSRREIGA